jgi:hypothetical protein
MTCYSDSIVATSLKWSELGTDVGLSRYAMGSGQLKLKPEPKISPD